MIRNTVPTLLIITLIAKMCIASPSDENDLSKLSEALGQFSLHGFNQAAVSNGWQAPFIPSQWYLERESVPDHKKRSTQARVFGKDIAQRLDAWAAELASISDTPRNLAVSTDLLDMADWLAATPGYGNYLLAARCQDIATIGMGRALVDLDIPLQAASNLVFRLSAPWESATARAAVLNEEARTNLFSLSATDASLNEVWQNGQALLIKYSSAGAQAAFEGRNQEGFDALAQIVKMHGVKPVESPIFMQNLDFFKDDPLGTRGQPVTLLQKWDAKWHGKLVMGLESQNTQKLKALLVFRQHVGTFPARPQFSAEQQAATKAEIEAASKRGLKIVPFEAAFSSPGEAAFAQAWQRYATAETRNLDGAAWQAYKEITSGEFVDEDTKATRFEAQMTATPDPNAQ